MQLPISNDEELSIAVTEMRVNKLYLQHDKPIPEAKPEEPKKREEKKKELSQFEKERNEAAVLRYKDFYWTRHGVF